MTFLLFCCWSWGGWFDPPTYLRTPYKMPPNTPQIPLKYHSNPSQLIFLNSPSNKMFLKNHSNKLSSTARQKNKPQQPVKTHWKHLGTHPKPAKTFNTPSNTIRTPFKNTLSQNPQEHLQETLKTHQSPLKTNSKPPNPF